MDKDLSAICNIIGIPIKDVNVPTRNSSKHKPKENYYTNYLHEKIYNKKINEDLKLFNEYKDTIHV